MQKSDRTRGCVVVPHFFVNSGQKEKRKANILRTVFLAQGALWLPNEAPRMRRTRTDREDLFRDRSYFKHPRRDRQAFCENRVYFGVGGVFAAGDPQKKQKKKERQQLAQKPWLLITGDPKLNSCIAQRSMIKICGNCRIVNKRKPRPLSADAG